MTHKLPTPKVRKDAVKQAQRAKQRGWIEPRPCQDCGQPDPRVLRMHHPDYSKPLAVIWLCRKCHARERARLKREGGKPRVWREPWQPEPEPPPLVIPKWTSAKAARLKRLKRLAETSSADAFDFDFKNGTVTLRDR